MSPLHKLIVFIILALFTLYSTLVIGQYQEIGPEIIKNANFDDGLNHWSQTDLDNVIISDNQKTVKIHSADIPQVISLTQTIYKPYLTDLMKLSGDIKTVKVVPGGASKGMNARLSLICFDNNDHRIANDPRVIALLGNNPWDHYAKVFKVHRESQKCLVSAELLKATGTMWIKNVSLREVFEKPTYPYLRSISILLWTIFLVWLLYPVILRCQGIALKGIVSLMIISVLVGTLISGSIFNQYNEDAVTGIEKMTIQGSDSDDSQQSEKTETNRIVSMVLKYAKKIGHFILFGTLGISFALVISVKHKAEWLLIIVMFAGATELLQFFVEGRSPSFLDWIIDLAGGLIGLLLLLMVDRSKQIQRKRKLSIKVDRT